MELGGDLLVGDMSLLLSINIAGAGIDGRQQLRRMEPPEGLLRDLQQFPDQGRGRLHTVEPLACHGPEPDRRKWQFHDSSGAQMAPVLLRELIKGDAPLPIVMEPFDGLRGEHTIPAAALIASPLTGCLRLRIRQGLQPRARLGLVSLRDSIQHIDQPMVPASRFGRRGLLLGQRGPDPHRQSCSARASAPASADPATPRPTTLWIRAARSPRLILVRVQGETNYPGPCADAPHAISIRRQPWQAGFQGTHHPGHV